jgi:hypothetical protein
MERGRTSSHPAREREQLNPSSARRERGLGRRNRSSAFYFKRYREFDI